MKETKLTGESKDIVLENIEILKQLFPDIIVEDNIVLVEGRLSMREDEPVKVVVSSIKEFSENIQEPASAQKIKQIMTLRIDITNPATYVKAAESNTFLAPIISFEFSIEFSFNKFKALLLALYSTGRVTKFNKIEIENIIIPIKMKV